MHKNILFLLGDIWSIKKNQGMPSIFKVLEASQKKYSIDIYTTDKYRYEKELPNAEIFYFKDRKKKFKNRYLDYIHTRLNNIILNIKYIIKFIQNKREYDLIYCSSSIPIYAAIFIKKFYKTKTIHRIYGTFLYENIDSKLDKIKKFEEVLLFKTSADKYIITDDGTKGDKVAQYFNIPKEKLIFLKNGVDIYKFKKSKEQIREELNLDKNSFYFLTVSRLAGWKRVDRAIKAMNLISNKNIKLLIIGDGEEREKLKKMSKNENTIFVGSLAREEVHKYMYAADAFISMYDVSNIGNPLLEALSYGLPIITYDSGNTAEVINGINGILISKKDKEDLIIQDLVKYMELLYSDNKLRTSLFKNSLEYAQKNLYSWSERVDKEINIIEELING